MSLLAALAVTAAAAPSEAGDGALDEIVRAEILDGWTTDRGTRMAALRLSLAPGWKTYWRAPGDAGIPPHFDWTGSRNLAAVSFHWPTPEVFDTSGLRTVGYAGELVLPLELRPAADGVPIRLEARIELGVCESVCIPAEVDVAAELSGAGRMAPAIRAALGDQPVPAARAGVRAVACDLSPIADGLQLDARIDLPRIGAKEVALVETGDPGVWVSEPMVGRSGGTLHVRADLVPPPGEALAIDRSTLRFTLLGASRAVDIRGCG